MKILNLNVSLAWERVKKDLQNRNFVNASLFYKIIDFHNTEWLQKLKFEFEEGNYHPKSIEIIEKPKGKGLIRPGSLLTLEDNVFYSALVQECYLKILQKIDWAQSIVDFAYQPSLENYLSSDWFKDRFVGWTQFREKSSETLNKGYSCLVVTDITGFYENIDINTLISDLKFCEVDSFITENISRCLNRWSQITGKGIPQGNSASDLLAKLYLNNVDLGMISEGFCYMRYVDDIRVFCENEIEAKKALKVLSRLLRRRGLNLQSAKTEILNADKAVQMIDGTQGIINALTIEFRNEVFDFFNIMPSCLSADETHEINNDETPIEVYKRAMQLQFIDNSASKTFNKTLFHYLINKLAKYKQWFAVKYCLSLLEIYPEETEYILKYCSSVDDNVSSEPTLSQISEFLLKFIVSEIAIYDYQNFEILTWLSQYNKFCLDNLLPVCRQIAFDNNKPYYYRFVARDILGQVGNGGDLEKLQEHIAFAQSELEKAELVCCLKRLEKSRRNSLFQRVVNDGLAVKMAVEFIKAS